MLFVSGHQAPYDVPPGLPERDCPVPRRPPRDPETVHLQPCCHQVTEHIHGGGGSGVKPGNLKTNLIFVFVLFVFFFFFLQLHSEGTDRVHQEAHPQLRDFVQGRLPPGHR